MIYLLKPKSDEYFEENDIKNPWEPWYDKSFGHVVVADTEEQARVFTQEHSGGENYEIDDNIFPWLSEAHSDCVVLGLSSDNTPRHILTDMQMA